MRELFFDFEDFQTRNFAPIGTIDGVRFSPNAIALVSLDEEGEGLFNATRTSPPGTTVISYAEAIINTEDAEDSEQIEVNELVTGDRITIDLRNLSPSGIGWGNFSFFYTSPNREHIVEIFDREGNSLGSGVLFSTPGETFNEFLRFSTTLPPNTGIIAIGSEATELAIDNIRISYFSTLIADPIITSTPTLVVSTQNNDFLQAAQPRLTIPLPPDLISDEKVITNIGNVNNGSATILPGGVGVEFIPDTTSLGGFGSFDYTLRDRHNQFATATATINFRPVTAMQGRDGNDTLIGDQFDQTLDGGPGNDSILGGSGNDTLLGGPGDDTLFGQGGNDRLQAGSGNNLLYGGVGNDTLLGGVGNDSLFGGLGDDLLQAGSGDNILDGGAGNDTLLGGIGNNSLFGGEGNDCLSGGGGNNWLEGGAGVNTLTAGTGNDTLVYLSPNDRGTQPDRILNFTPNSDRLVFQSQSLDQGGFGLSALNSDTQTLNPQQFTTNRESLPEDTEIPILLYDTTTGLLEYDIDGLGTSPPIAIAQLQSEDGSIPNLSPNDIILVDPVSLARPETVNIIAREVRAATPQEINGSDSDDTIFAIAPEPFNPVEIPVLANDSPETGLFISSVSNITGGDVVLLNDNTIVRFTPTLPGGTQASFTYTASDGNTQDSANVFIDILPVTRINGLGGDDVLVGSSAPDLLYGGAGNDSLFGDSGNDTLVGGSGADTLSGGDGDDVVYGGSGPDLLYGGAGNDCLFGETGDDTLVGGSGADTLKGGGGNDLLYGGSGPDLLYGGQGDDSLFGEAGDDTLFGDSGNDTLVGGSGEDVLYGGLGNDLLYGGSGNDIIYGGQGDDFLLGDDGDDTLFGGAGNDTLFGGAGNDVFAYISRSQITTGTDLIVDFEAGSDRILFDREQFGFIQIGTTPENSLSPQQFILVETGTYQDNLSLINSPILAYELQTGNLIYDPDGSGTQPPEIIANLQGTPTLSVNDIILIGIAGDDTLPDIDDDDPTDEDPRNVTAFALINGTPGNDAIAVSDTINAVDFVGVPVTIPASDNERPAVINTITDLIGGNVNILEGGTAAEFIPTLPGGNIGSFSYEAIDSQGNLIRVPVNVNILTAIDGNLGDDTLIGSDGNDSLFGNLGNDCLIGGAGDDTLVGGEGSDTFAYLSPNQINLGVDLIVDFTPGSDRLLFDRDQFRFTQIGTTPQNSLSPEQFIFLETGELNPDNLGTISSPILAYELETGTLIYDPDASGVQPPVTVATLIGNPPLSIDDILLIGTTTDTLTPPDDDETFVDDSLIANPNFATTPSLVIGTPGNDTIFAEGTSLNRIEIPVLDNDSPVGGLTINSISGVSGGQVNILPGNTSVEFIPLLPGPFGGQFTYTAQDSLGNTASALVSVSIATVDTIDGNAGDDFLAGHLGPIVLIGGPGNDTLLGSAFGNDLLLGNEGNDSLVGGPGDNTLIGGLGDDVLIGGPGNDTLVGGSGGNTLTGLGGNNVFLYSSTNDVLLSASDLITDFVPGRDTLQFNDEFILADPLFVVTDTLTEADTLLDTLPVSQPVIIYERLTGQLIYDSNADGLGGGSIIAQFTPDESGAFPNISDTVRDDSSILIF
ncbi:calcium-binding protein [Arthrospira platensis NCB002]|jgi:Ca2+-binding RTX toxin-like protein|uniref:Hemolysin-type calcium-binding region protein n=1 Tax=Limnospira platensis NIES-46 TaxID=1236695 RepID=A0A5M3T9Y5_LIMPL|nr:calcium-binding protein [Arthrospira platensis]MDF2210227.1 calcium-binding protein [Arthrospira platensis NCB002]BAI89850.1 hemolysin-type calcium-binding region protein [Arthrospira platensis NIES-39]BDT12187.1 hemolysin-type calcium-binding region protein [Arthrospira platensis NIES-39]GCE95687.1 hemolysin-type calcium-binding region protein [Arthrospira platensis NIES-46]